MPIAQILLAGGGPVPTYTLTPATSSTDEGASLTFTVGGTNIPDGTYYWDITHSGTTSEDFTATTGTVVVTDNSGSFTVTPTSDTTTEGSETFIVALRLGSTSGTILASSGSVTINDTSLTGPTPFSANFYGDDTIRGFQGGNGWWDYVQNASGAWLAPSTFSGSAPAWNTILYPDGVTTGHTYDFSNGQFMFSPTLVRAGAWATTAISINFWFYPTVNGVQLLTELGQPQLSADYHTTLLEIDSSNYIKAKFWQTGSVGQHQIITSTNTVVLNQWNHIYFAEDINGAHTFALNGVATTGLPTYTRLMPTTTGATNIHYAVGGSDTTNMGNTGGFQGKIGILQIHDHVEASTYTDGQYSRFTPAGPSSLVFNNPQGDYLSTPASADWNLGNNWTMEFWIRSNNNSASNINISGGQWGLINQGGWYYGMPDDNCILVGMAGGYLTINQSATGDISFAEPTTQVWTHVAIVNNGGGSAQKVYYNGVEQTPTGANYTTNGKTNTTETLYIGRLEPPGYGGLFDGKMALVRISNTAKYTAPFTATTTYGVEADTKLFLSLTTPFADAMGHTITNNGVTLSTSIPQSLTGIVHPFTGGSFGTTYCVFGDPNLTAFSAIPVGARITSNIPGFGIRTATSSTADGVGRRVVYDATGLTGPTSTSDVFNFYW